MHHVPTFQQREIVPSSTLAQAIKPLFRLDCLEHLGALDELVCDEHDSVALHAYTS